MIPLSLALVVASVGTLVGGLAASSQPLVWTSLAAGLAALALVAGSVARRRTRLQAGPGDPGSVGPGTSVPPLPFSPTLPSSPAVRPAQPASASPTTPDGRADAASGQQSEQGSQGREEQLFEPNAATPGRGETGTAFGELAGTESAPGYGAAELSDTTGRPLGEPFPEPLGAAGEPPAEDVPIGDALRVAQLPDEVVVTDGHPRYHLADCPTLAGGPDRIALAVSVARRGGFTPCAVCAPDSALLARSRSRARPALPPDSS